MHRIGPTSHSDVYKRQLYITPEGFMEDLAAVKDKAHITVKLNSCGGDLYTCLLYTSRCV